MNLKDFSGKKCFLKIENYQRWDKAKQEYSRILCSKTTLKFKRFFVIHLICCVIFAGLGIDSTKLRNP